MTPNLNRRQKPIPGSFCLTGKRKSTQCAKNGISAFFRGVSSEQKKAEKGDSHLYGAGKGAGKGIGNGLTLTNGNFGIGLKAIGGP
jgi:hypothetical protein